MQQLLLDIYVWLNMFRALPRPSSGAYNCISSLWFYCWSMVARPWPTTLLPPSSNSKIRGC